MLRRLLGRLKPRNIQFNNGNTAQLFEVRPSVSARKAMAALDLSPYTAAIVVHSGAAGMESTYLEQFKSVISDGLVRFAADHQVLVIDGATDAGAATLIGEARQAQGASFPLLGITVSGGITYPGGPPAISGRYPLEPNHSDFLIVKASQFGAESELIVDAAGAMGRPHLALIINGGDIVRRETAMHVRRGNRLIVFKGSGRYADELAVNLPTAYPNSHITIFDAEAQSPEALYKLLKQQLIEA